MRSRPPKIIIIIKHGVPTVYANQSTKLDILNYDFLEDCKGFAYSEGYKRADVLEKEAKHLLNITDGE